MLLPLGKVYIKLQYYRSPVQNVVEVQHTPAAVVAASGGMVLQQHIEDNQERAISMMCTYLQIEPSDLLTEDLTSQPEFMKVLTTVAVACKD